MTTINTNTAVTVPAGALLKFAPGGQGAAVDSDGNSYVIGRSDVRCGPYTAAKTFQIIVTAGPINYVIDADGSADDAIRVNEFASTITPSPSSAAAVRGVVASGSLNSNLYLPNGASTLADALPKFSKAVRMARGGVHTMVAVARNSTGVGYAATDGGNIGGRAWSPVSVMSKSLKRLGVTVNTQNFFGDCNVAVDGNTVAQYDPRVTLGAGWSAVMLKGPGGGGFQNLTTTNPLTFQCDAPIDRAIFFYTTNNNAGNMTADVGGAALVTMTGNQTPAFRSTGVISLGAPALYAVNIKNPAGSGQCYFNGFVGWNSNDPGISVINIGWNGMTGANLNEQSPAWLIYSAFTVLSAAGVSLYITGDGINDGLAGVSAATRTTNMASTIARMKSTGASDVLLIGDPPSLTNRVSQAAQDAYDLGYQSIVNTSNVPYLSGREYLGPNDSAGSAILFADDYGHLTRYGYSVFGLLPASQIVGGIS